MIYEYNGSNIVDGLYYFYASWNSNCNTLKERINRIDRNYNINIYKVNTTKFNNIKKSYNVTKIPSYLLIKDNNVVSSINGNVDYYTLSKWLKDNLDKYW